MTITGGCLCGAVRFSTDAEPLAARACWCRVCQYIAAGNATINVIIPSAGLEVSGEIRIYESVADSGNPMRRTFCPACGTALFSQAAPRPDILVVRGGTFDDPEIARPKATIWTASAPAWACIDPDLPQTEGQPTPVPPR